MAESALVRRALADEHRVRIVAELRAEPDGLGVRELGRRVGLHENTIRWHLGILGDAGLVEAHPAAHGKPGRPRMLYFARPAVDEAVDRDDHRLLATILTGTVAELPDGERRAEASGRAWGRYLVRRPSPLARVTDEQGFAPVIEGTEIHMRRCPFHDLAEQTPEIVCGVHRGIVSGALAELGSDLEMDGLDVFVRPDLCVARLARRRSQSG